jgi:PhnB protein
MSTATLNPYLFFTGTCAEAMEFYKSIFGGELHVSFYGEMGPEGFADKVMHASLVGGQIELMASDSTRESFGTSCISLSLSGTDEAALRDLFDKLSVGGTAITPLKMESWGDTFGQLTDKFGIDWMVNIGAAK